MITPDIGRILVVIGLVIAGVGLLAALGIRLPLGRLPGDISITGEHGGLFIPITTMLLLSLILTLLVNVFWRR
ncbi:MAG: DUF2905 domain-containing protein [Chloroflexota bacterium]|nr:DUF2905 domain-containing protein [Chloroflexota bacterium]